MPGFFNSSQINAYVVGIGVSGPELFKFVAPQRNLNPAPPEHLWTHPDPRGHRVPYRFPLPFPRWRLVHDGPEILDALDSAFSKVRCLWLSKRLKSRQVLLPRFYYVDEGKICDVLHSQNRSRCKNVILNLFYALFFLSKRNTVISCLCWSDKYVVK